MRAVWKFALADEVPINEGARVLRADWDRGGHGWVWCEVDTDAPAVVNRFVVVGTGDQLPDGYEHVDTMLDGLFVWHLYRLEAS